MARRRSRNRCPYGFEGPEQCPYHRTQDLVTTMLTLLLTRAMLPSGEGVQDVKAVEELLSKLLGKQSPGPPSGPTSSAEAEDAAESETEKI